MTPRNVNLHPHTNHPSSIPSKTFDTIIIGAGPVSNFGVARFARAGLSVLVVEAELFGGDCPYWACVPSKALLRPIEALGAAKAVAGAREQAQGERVDAADVFKRRDAFVNGWDDSPMTEGKFSPYNKIMMGLGSAEEERVTMVRGLGRLEGVREVSVQPQGEEKRYQFSAKYAVVLATGSQPVIPDIPGLKELEEGSELWDSRHATGTNFVPEHLIILGAGVAGCESATTFAGFGGKVTLVGAASQIMRGFEPEAAEMVSNNMRSEGIDVRVKTRATEIKKHGKNDIEVIFDNESSVRGSTILTATGRVPRTFDVGLEKLSLKESIRPGKNVPTNDSFQVETKDSEPWLYAVSDVTGRNPTTHSGVYHIRVMSNAVLQHIKATADPADISHLSLESPRMSETRVTSEPHAIPRCIFTSPAVASVGHTLASAKAAGIPARDVSIPFEFAGAWLWADKPFGEGWGRWVLDEEDRMIGATYCCHEASDLLVPATLAVSQKMKLSEMLHVVPCFPTRGEVWRHMLDAAGY